MAGGDLTIYKTGLTDEYTGFLGWWTQTPHSALNNSTVSVGIVVTRSASALTPVYGSVTASVTLIANDNTGVVKSQTTPALQLDPGGTVTLFQQDFTCYHDAEGNCAVSFSLSINGAVTGTGAGNFTLDHITAPVGLVTTLREKTETSVTINWSATSDIDYLWYSTDNGGTWTANGSITGTAGAYTITGLSHNTSYSIKTKVQRKGTNVSTISDAITTKTYSYPYATSMPNFTIGDTLRIGLFNPLNRNVTVYLDDRNNTQVGYLTTSGAYVQGFAGATVQTALYASISAQISGSYRVRVKYGSHTETRSGGQYSANTAVCKPTPGTATYKDTAASVVTLTGNDQYIVQGRSLPRITLTGASGNNSASISSVSATCLSQTITLTPSGVNYVGDFSYINAIADVTVTVTVTDSRGITASTSVIMTVVPYQLPTLSATLKRRQNYYTDTYITPAAVYAPVTIGGVDKNTITITYSATSSTGTTLTGTLTNNTTDTVNLDNLYDWDVRIDAQDATGIIVHHDYFVSKGTPIIFFDKDRYSVGINCFPDNNKTFEVDGAVLNRNVMTARAATNTTGTSSQKISVAADVTVGDQLTIDSGSIKIGAKLSNVLVSAVVNSLSVTAGNHGVDIKQNSTVVAYGYRTMTATPNSESISIAPVLLSVTANDTISLYVSGFASTETVSVILTVEAMA